jgi:hypothetical protein
VVSESKVIPFRKRPPSEAELKMYRKITRYWHPELRKLMFPDHFRGDEKKDEASR